MKTNKKASLNITVWHTNYVVINCKHLFLLNMLIMLAVGWTKNFSVSCGYFGLLERVEKNAKKNSNSFNINCTNDAANVNNNICNNNSWMQYQESMCEYTKNKLFYIFLVGAQWCFRPFKKNRALHLLLLFLLPWPVR